MRFLLALLFAISPAALLAAPGLTIYNQNFAVVRDTISLDLKQGENDVKFDGATVHLGRFTSQLLDNPRAFPQVIKRNPPLLKPTDSNSVGVRFGVHFPN